MAMVWRRAAIASKVSRPPIPILTYHQLDVLPPALPEHAPFVVTPSAFARQMKLFHTLGYRGLSMSQLEPYLKGEAFGKVFGITLDDGYLNTLQHALPVLTKFGFTSTCYVVSSELGGSNIWDQPAGMRPQPLMDERELAQWLAHGQEIGGHTRNHVNLLKCDEETAFNEISGCRHDLQQRLGISVSHFCYPFGQFAHSHVDMVMSCGYRTATTQIGARSRHTDHLFMLPRVSFNAQLMLSTAAQSLAWRHTLKKLASKNAHPVGNKKSDSAALH
jgi:peptidoglycan/xylan/chitin deacetylase (PgdA/CDA1 family)